MKKSSLLAAGLLAITLLLTLGSEVYAQRVAVGVRIGGPAYYYRPYGYYPRPYGYYPYGWYRPYPVIGVGIYAPYYGSYVYPVDPGYAVYPAPAVVAGAPPAAPAAPAANAPVPMAVGQQTSEKPAPDNAGHLQLIVPEGATVTVDGQKLSQTGPTREIVSPPVTPGKKYTYHITVRHTDAAGKVVEDTRDIHFQANDWFAIDFTRPAPPLSAPPMPMPLPLK